MEQPLLFLIKLAWACRYRLPILITVGFMALDIRMQLEIHVQMRRIRRGPFPVRGGRHQRDDPNLSLNRVNSDDSSSSWLTVSEDEEDDDNIEFSDNTVIEDGASTSLKSDAVNDVNVENVNNPEMSEDNAIQDDLLHVNVEN